MDKLVANVAEAVADIGDSARPAVGGSATAISREYVDTDMAAGGTRVSARRQ